MLRTEKESLVIGHWPLAIWVAFAIWGWQAGVLMGGVGGGTIYVSPRGDDEGNGTVAGPVRTPERALAIAGTGDTILIRQGRYVITHPLWIDKAGVTMESFPGEVATLVAANDNTDQVVAVVVIVANDVTLENLNIVGGSYYGVKIDTNGTAATRGITLRGCQVSSTGADCIKTYNADRLLIEDCQVGPSGVRDPSNAEGIDSIGSKGVMIRRCYIHDTATNGVYLKGGAKQGVIESCRIENTGKYAGILLGQDTDLEYMRDGARYEAIDCVARNNLIVNTGAAGVGTYSGDNVRFENNTLVNVARSGQAGLWIVTNSRNVPARKVTFRNNIMVMSSERPMVFVLGLADPLNSDFNIYYNTRELYQFRYETLLDPKRSETWRFGEWKQEMKVDANSKTVDPKLDEKRLYMPREGSPATGIGAQQGVSATNRSLSFRRK